MTASVLAVSDEHDGFLSSSDTLIELLQMLRSSFKRIVNGSLPAFNVKRVKRLFERASIRSEILNDLRTVNEAQKHRLVVAGVVADYRFSKPYNLIQLPAHRARAINCQHIIRRKLLRSVSAVTGLLFDQLNRNLGRNSLRS